ncbi:MAG: hypothetical protein HC827_23530 [Cyanobacteria bacterium RM1_2_2]|nr:hypothetical protein [Cyanobacteria bacterium RM1_2_2]
MNNISESTFVGDTEMAVFEQLRSPYADSPYAEGRASKTIPSQKFEERQA